MREHFPKIEDFIFAIRMNGRDYYPTNNRQIRLPFPPHSVRNDISLVLKNTQHTNRMDVSIQFCGEHVGDFRVNPNQTFVIERPANVSRKFVAIKLDAYPNQGPSNLQDAGLIVLQISSEYNPPLAFSNVKGIALESATFRGEHNATGALGNHSSQDFSSVGPLRDPINLGELRYRFIIVDEDSSLPQRPYDPPQACPCPGLPRI